MNSTNNVSGISPSLLAAARRKNAERKAAEGAKTSTGQGHGATDSMSRSSSASSDKSPSSPAGALESPRSRASSTSGTSSSGGMSEDESSKAPKINWRNLFPEETEITYVGGFPCF